MACNFFQNRALIGSRFFLNSAGDMKPLHDLEDVLQCWFVACDK
jgi:hypothetical protein